MEDDAALLAEIKQYQTFLWDRISTKAYNIVRDKYYGGNKDSGCPHVCIDVEPSFESATYIEYAYTRSAYWIILDDRPETPLRNKSYGKTIQIDGPSVIAEYLHYGDDIIDTDRRIERQLVLINYNGQDIHKYLSCANSVILLYVMDEMDKLNIEHREMLLDIKHEQFRVWVENVRKNIRYFINTYHPDGVWFDNMLTGYNSYKPEYDAYKLSMIKHCHSSKFYKDMSALVLLSQEECDKLNKHEYQYDASTYDKLVCDLDLANYKDGYVFEWRSVPPWGEALL